MSNERLRGINRDHEDEQKSGAKFTTKNPAKVIRHKGEIAREAKARLRKLEKETICECPHTDRGSFAIRPTNRKRADGSTIYICKNCGKEINISQLTENEIDSAIDVVDRMCDTIKMLSELSNEKDAKIYKKIAKLQYRVTTQLKDTYNAAKEKGKRGKNNNRNNNNNRGDGFAEQPISR